MRLIAIALSVLIPAQAMALSCIRPSAERSFVRAQESEDLYVVVSGRLTFDQSKYPKRPEDLSNEPKTTKIPAMLAGKSLSKAGFVTPFKRPITLELQCFGPWCGSASNGVDHLVFMKKTDTGYLLSVDPCYSNVFQEPTVKMLKSVTKCMNGASCIPEF